MEKRICGDVRWRILGIFLTPQMNGSKRNTIFLGYVFDDGYILSIEWALASVIKHIPFFINMRMVGAFLEFRNFSIAIEWQIPKLDAIAGLVGYLEPLMRKVFRVSKERLFLGRRKNTQTLNMKSVIFLGL